MVEARVPRRSSWMCRSVYRRGSRAGAGVGVGPGIKASQRQVNWRKHQQLLYAHAAVDNEQSRAGQRVVEAPGIRVRPGYSELGFQCAADHARLQLHAIGD